MHYVSRMKRRKITRSSHLTQKKHLTESKALSWLKHIQKTRNTELLQHDKECIWKSTTTKILSHERVKSFPSQYQEPDKMPAFATAILHCAGSSSQSNWTRTKNKRHPNWKRRSKTTSIHRGQDLIYRKSQRIHKKLLHEFSKAARYKINTNSHFFVHLHWTIWEGN